jgi:hypothetical protein
MHYNFQLRLPTTVTHSYQRRENSDDKLCGVNKYESLHLILLRITSAKCRIFLTDFYQCLIAVFAAGLFLHMETSEILYSSYRQRLPGVHKFSWTVRAHFWIGFEVLAAVTMKVALVYDVASGSCLLSAVCLFRVLFFTFRNNSILFCSS